MQYLLKVGRRKRTTLQVINNAHFSANIYLPLVEGVIIVRQSIAFFWHSTQQEKHDW
jgi:hypothetical protein